jgi:hypothetical protein
VAGLGENVLRQRDDDRPLSPARRECERARYDFRDPVGVVNLDHRLGHRPEYSAQVELLEGLAPAVGPGHLSDEQDQRRRVLSRGVHADGSVRRARAAGDDAYPGPSGQLARRLGRVCGRRFVAATHQAQPVAMVEQAVQQGQVALTGDAERELAAVQDELVGEQLAARARPAHESSSGSSTNTVYFWGFGLAASSSRT